MKQPSWLLWIVGIDLFFIFTTALNPYLPSTIKHILNNHLDLGVEMNLASWWSAFNLLVAALLAYELFSTLAGLQRRAWLILALILAALSVDEIGSIHERIDDMRLLLLIAALGGLPFLYAVVTLFRQEKTRWTALAILMGFALFGTVFLQEYIEYLRLWPAGLVGLRTGVEEGSELLGMLILIANLVRQRTISQRGLPAVTPDPYRFKALPIVLGAGALLHAFLSLLAVSFPDIGLRGNPAVWYPVAVFILLACAAFWMYLERDRGRPFWLALAGYSLLNSVAVVYLFSARPEGSRFAALGPLSNVYFLIVIQSAIILLLYGWAFGWEPQRILPGLLLPLLALLFGFTIHSLAAQYLFSGLFSFWAASLFLWREGQPAAQW